ncbi:MAG: DUF3667 domain-containing protein [Bacteroidetes bacterium]|nr:DUF3667 domain-containing protein [Bacteroidota bacterium]
MEKCLNCGTELVGNFCHNCGQQKLAPGISVRNSFDEYFYKSIYWESSFSYTVRDLFLAPGNFVLNFINGKRKDYVKPVGFFLMTVGFFILMFHFLSENHFSYMKPIFIGEDTSEMIDSNISVNDFRQLEVSRLNYLMFMLPPILALFHTIIFRNKDVGYGERLAFYLYILGFGALISVIFLGLALITPVMWELRLIPLAVYYIYAIVQFSKANIFSGIIKALIVLIAGNAVYYGIVTLLLWGYLELVH